MNIEAVLLHIYAALSNGEIFFCKSNKIFYNGIQTLSF